MSHFTTIKTKITELDILKKSLEDLGYSYKEGNIKIEGFSGKENVELAVRTSGYEIGFRKRGGSYEIVADWWGIPINKEEFISKLTQKYAYNVILSQAKKMRFSIAEEEKQKDGSIKVVLRRWK